MLGPFHYAFVQRGALEALLLAVPAGLLGTWIVLRGLAFFAHRASVSQGTRGRLVLSGRNGATLVLAPDAGRR